MRGCRKFSRVGVGVGVQLQTRVGQTKFTISKPIPWKIKDNPVPGTPSGSVHVTKLSIFPLTIMDCNAFPDSLIASVAMSDDCLSILILSIPIRSFSVHHLRCGGWLTLVFSKGKNIWDGPLKLFTRSRSEAC